MDTIPFTRSERVYNLALKCEVCGECDLEYRLDRVPVVNLYAEAEIASAMRFGLNDAERVKRNYRHFKARA